TDQIHRLTALGEAPDDFVTGLFSGHAAPKLVHERLQRWRLTSPVVRHGDLTAVRAYPMRQAVAALAHPVLAVTGQEDARATAPTVRDMLTGNPRATVVAIRQAGCMAMAEQPSLFNREVEQFLAKVGVACPAPVDGGSNNTGYRRF
ncbi:MAG TPA: alpha/beta hydrolase, partial [Symbiobacteriaceae bacterium]|nr:alpha/beta hydrolase [Symbiobacteriaceae bacterium]